MPGSIPSFIFLCLCVFFFLLENHGIIFYCILMIKQLSDKSLNLFIQKEQQIEHKKQYKQSKL